MNTETFVAYDHGAIREAFKACEHHNDLATFPFVIDGLKQVYKTGHFLFEQLYLLWETGAGYAGNEEYIHCVANMLTSIGV